MKRSYSLAICGIVAALGLAYLSALPAKKVTDVMLKPNEAAVITLGVQVYADNCASCHGVYLEGQANWQQRGPDGYMPAPPHNEAGHTWHHPDTYLFSMTKYGIERMIGKTYPNNMPAYDGDLTDEEIIAALSNIKSTWPKSVQLKHDQINARAKARSEES